MRNLFYLLITVFSTGFLFTACSDDDDNGSNLYQPYNLKGAVYYREYGMDGGTYIYEMYEFNSNEEADYLQRKGYVLGEVYLQPVTYSCKYDYPFLQFKQDGKVIVTCQFQNRDSLLVGGNRWFKRLNN